MTVAARTIQASPQAPVLELVKGADLTVMHAIVEYMNEAIREAEEARRKKDRQEAASKLYEQFRLKKDMEHFTTFTDDWDGEDGKPLQQAALHNFEALLPLLSLRALQGIDISPENNGTLLVTSKTREAGVNIGNNTYTYYIIENGQVTGESLLAYDADCVLRQIENITL